VSPLKLWIFVCLQGDLDTREFRPLRRRWGKSVSTFRGKLQPEAKKAQWHHHVAEKSELARDIILIFQKAFGKSAVTEKDSLPEGLTKISQKS
jgi:hypothetical protein